MRIIRATHSVGVEEREWEDGETGFSPETNALCLHCLSKYKENEFRHMRITRGIYELAPDV